MTNPYATFGPRAFWRSAVADRSPFEIDDLWTPRLRVARETPIVTAGSCFAQHFARALVRRGYRWLDAEPAPAGLHPQDAADFHYGTFSFRTGNIYTARMLRQWLSWALDDTPVPDLFWQEGARFFDPFRPAVEPGGFVSLEEARQSRAVTLTAIRRAVDEAGLFVFTLGLTECWREAGSDIEYAVCPGTVAGRFDADAHRFVNAGFASIREDLVAAIALLRARRPDLPVLLTVSPVPLTATASGQHVLTATSQSKSTLRAVAGEVAQELPLTDYFPSYEIIAHPAFRGMFYGPNQRQVTQAGVDFVMDAFFRAQGAMPPEPHHAAPPAAPAQPDTDPAAVRCEEEMLDAFRT